MKAQSTYKDQYVELEGYLGTIDSDGKYIGLSAGEDNYNYLFQEIQCYIKTEEQRNAIMEKNKGDRLIIRGKIINVGEVLGYSLNIESIGQTLFYKKQKGTAFAVPFCYMDEDKMKKMSHI